MGMWVDWVIIPRIKKISKFLWAQNVVKDRQYLQTSKKNITINMINVTQKHLDLVTA